MKEWESQNLISLLSLKLRRRQLRDSFQCDVFRALETAIRGSCPELRSHGGGSPQPSRLVWGSRRVPCGGWELLAACPLRRMGLTVSPRRMGLVTACPRGEWGSRSSPVEDGAGHGVSPCGGWGSWSVPTWRMGAGPNGHWERESWASATATDRVTLEGSLSPTASFTLKGRNKRLWPRRETRLRASALQSSSVLRRFQFTLAGP